MYLLYRRGIHNQEGKLGRCWIRKGVIGSPTFAAELHSNGFTVALANIGADASDYGGIIPHICHGRHGHVRVNFFWPV